jgi:quercetin dioxygenase-like cupin family protein
MASDSESRDRWTTGQVGRLADLVDYQDEAVVSRTVLKQKAGSVTIFAFDAGQSLSEHTVPHDAMVQVLEGVVQITIGGTPHRLVAGEAIVMPGNVSHAVQAVERFKMALTLIKSQ